MKIIVGLGNIGKEYENTRHNVGWMFLDYLEEKDAVYTELLTEKNLLLKCRTMYLRNKEKRFLEGT